MMNLESDQVHLHFSLVVANFGLFASARPQFPSYTLSSSPSLSCVFLGFSGLTIGSCLRDGVIWYQASIAFRPPADFPNALETVWKFSLMADWQLSELPGGAPLAPSVGRRRELDAARATRHGN